MHGHPAMTTTRHTATRVAPSTGSWQHPPLLHTLRRAAVLSPSLFSLKPVLIRSNCLIIESNNTPPSTLRNSALLRVGPPWLCICTGHARHRPTTGEGAARVGARAPSNAPSLRDMNNCVATPNPSPRPAPGVGQAKTSSPQVRTAPIPGGRDILWCPGTTTANINKNAKKRPPT